MNPPEKLPSTCLTDASLHRRIFWLGVSVAAVWALAAVSISSRVHLVLEYATVESAATELEPLLATNAAWLLVSAMAGLWCAMLLQVLKLDSQVAARGVAMLGMASLPLVVWLLRLSGLAPLPPAYWEPLWLAAWSGLSFSRLGGSLLNTVEASRRGRTMHVAIALLSGLAASWWYLQSLSYYRDYLLGYNDFGHFAQRVANTAAGRGFLRESPVLPAFWDHFNPGLILFVPLWKLMPSAELFFLVHAISLAAGAICIAAIARRLRYGDATALLFACAWLAHPALGQMNVAYTYGWHPISLAIPLLLASLWALLAQRFTGALLLAVAAMSMEESVIVIVSLFCATGAALAWRRQRLGDKGLEWGVSARVWLTCALATAIAFLLVYRFSGIADFQTRRFHALGDSSLEIILSPWLRPEEFWGQIFRWDKLAFVLSLWLPCYLPSLLRGWRWLLPTLLPLAVLIVWDHAPATSLAFQYSSTLLPLFWLATLVGAKRDPAHCAVGALATSLMLSLYVGQLPYSSPSLLDVVGRTYLQADAIMPRGASQEDGRWLSAQVEEIRRDGSETLATGRIAAHLVGNRDLETVGQYLERREALSALADRRGQPLRHYRWIILDRQEQFQQLISATEAVEAEARQAGFTVVAERFNIVVLAREAPFAEDAADR